jgi:hypothetical protein
MKTAIASFSVSANVSPSVTITQEKVFVTLSSTGFARQFAAFLRSSQASFVLDKTGFFDVLPGTYSFSVGGEFLNDTTLKAKLDYDRKPTLG